ncbi:hypothetical protein MMC10_007977 [Thelotrema lepadinum]|nr:hypothetical protein [Thelotrema lepadinum]
MLPTNSPHLSPNLTAEGFSDRSREPSPHRGGLTGRKGYNGPIASFEMTPPPSRHSTSPMPSHREGLFGRKGYNSPPPAQTTSEPNAHMYSPAMGPTFHDGLVGRKGYNAEHPGHHDIFTHSHSRSMSPVPDAPHYREGALRGRKGYNASPAQSREASPVPSTFSHSRTPSPNPRTMPSYNRRASESGALSGRKGYNGSPHLLPSETYHHHSGNRGRKGYNAPEHERHASAELTPEPIRRKSQVEYTNPVGLGIREGALHGRKGYNKTHDSSRSRSISPMPMR